MTNLDGLWAMRFDDFENCGIRNGGAVVIMGTRLYGGDGHFYYLGEFEIAGSQTMGRGSITHYSGRNLSAYGIPVDDRLEIEFACDIRNDRIVGHMWPAGREQPMLSITLRRLAELG